MEIKAGLMLEKSFSVGSEQTAKWVGSGSVNVLATPMLIAFIENTASECLEPWIDEGDTTVGTLVNITHEAPTPTGMRVAVTVEVEKVEGKAVHFRVEARDESQLIGQGRHSRVIVNKQRFEDKAKKKLAK